MLYDLESHRVTLAPDTFVAPTAVVIGRVTLGSHASVWFNAVLRGDVEDINVGDRTNIQDGAILHADPGKPLRIGIGVTIGHRAMLHGCRIGDHTLIGIGATVLNDAVIGNECIVGAHALVTEGKSFPDRVLLVGSPAKMARPLTEVEVEGLHDSAQHYVANAERFRKGLRPR